MAQIAAVIGRQFTFGLLEAVAGKDDDELSAGEGKPEPVRAEKSEATPAGGSSS